jgi:mono/diheme cytochrome c family protein
MTQSFQSIAAALAVGAIAGAAAPTRAVTPAEQMSRYAAEAGRAPEAARGQQFFTAAQGRDWSCATCHGAAPVVPGKHASTGKAIAALAPTANGERFTDSAKTEKWFRRNCNDVVGRECTAAEKADTLAWLLSLSR